MIIHFRTPYRPFSTLIVFPEFFSFPHLRFQEPMEFSLRNTVNSKRCLVLIRNIYESFDFSDSCCRSLVCLSPWFITMHTPVWRDGELKGSRRFRAGFSERVTTWYPMMKAVQRQSLCPAAGTLLSLQARAGPCRERSFWSGLCYGYPSNVAKSSSNRAP